MSDISKIISEVETLPVEERTKVVDSFLRTLNPSDPEIDKKCPKSLNHAWIICDRVESNLLTAKKSLQKSPNNLNYYDHF